MVEPLMSISGNLSRTNRGRFFCVLTLGFIVLSMGPAALAQFKFRKPPNRQLPSALDERSGEFVWQQFLWNRAIGKFNLSGSLVYRPARDKSRSYSINLDANWKTDSEETAISLAGSLDDVIQRTVVVDEDRKFFLRDSDCSQCLVELTREEQQDSISDELPITWFDLLMPYLYWGQPEYLGPERYIGRPAHRYALYNLDSDAGIQKVVVTLDEDYAAILKSDSFDVDDKLVKRMRVAGFKQFASEWMFSELYWENRSTRDSLRLSVKTFSIGE
ncbi:MAG: hypothetical protein AB3N63_14560 [Puniceicoccaceae bacterium]